MSDVKFRNITSEPMGDKPTTDLPGIGKVLSTRLKEGGFEKASQVYGQFLVLNRDHVRFETWMNINFQADRNKALKCSKALDAYYTTFN
ncbi:hypothetical protein FQR65_LT10673 [Abscondita terminalis]|nr:hypothetical protein FQR65_LT10673 [Abscondita terminalis]